MKTWNFLPDFTNALEEHLKGDEKRWGNTWFKRSRKGQEERTIKSFQDKFDKYLEVGQPIDWLAIAGDALICWIREQHPEIWKE